MFEFRIRRGARLRADGEDETHTERMTSARPEVERPFKAGSPRDTCLLPVCVIL